MSKFDSGLVSMELDDEEKMDMAMPSMEQPNFPWGLRISLTSDELEKLGIDVKEASVGDYFQIRALCCVSSISSNDTAKGPCDRLEAQIEAMSVPDLEDGDSGY